MACRDTPGSDPRMAAPDNGKSTTQRSASGSAPATASRDGGANGHVRGSDPDRLVRDTPGAWHRTPGAWHRTRPFGTRRGLTPAWPLWTWSGSLGVQRRSRGPCAHRPGAAAAERDAMLLAREQPADVRAMEDDDRDRGAGGECEHRPGGAEEGGEGRQRKRGRERGDRGVARRQENHDPGPGGGEGGKEGHRERDPAGRGNRLSPAREAQEERAPVTHQRGDPGEDADQVVAEPDPEERRRRALGDVQERDGEPELEAERPPHVRRPRVPAPDRANVDPDEQAREPIAPGQAAEEVAERDEKDSGQIRSGLDLVPRHPLVHDAPVQVAEEGLDVGGTVGSVVEEVRVLVDVERDERRRVPDRERVLGVAEVVEETPLVPVVGGPRPPARGHAGRLQVGAPTLDRAEVAPDQLPDQPARVAALAAQVLEVDLVVLD